MGKKRTIYQKAKESPANLSFNDLCKLAEQCGFILRKTKRKHNQGGSHKFYTHGTIERGIMNFQPNKGKAKPYQVKQLIDFIEDNNLIGDLDV